MEGSTSAWGRVAKSESPMERMADEAAERVRSK